MGLRLSETELQKSLDFCVNLFNPTTPEQHERVAKNVLFKELLDVTAPVVDPILPESVLNVEKNPKVVTVVEVGWGCGRGEAYGSRIMKWINSIAPPVVGGDAMAAISNMVKRPVSGGGRVRAGSESSSECERMAEMQMVLQKINARRVVHSEYGINNLESEPVDGFVVRLERGRLGLVRVK
jgi:flavine halogenase